MKRSDRLTRTPAGVLVLLGALLVLSSIIAQLSVWPVHSVQRRTVRHEMKDRILAGLPKSALTVFRFSPAEYEEVDLVDGGREIRSNGVLYDIVRTYEESDGSWVIEAARDDKETKLMANLDRMVQGRMTTDKQGRQQRVRIVATWAPFCEPWNAISSPLPPMRSLGFADIAQVTGRSAEPIDPGPPRMA